MQLFLTFIGKNYLPATDFKFVLYVCWLISTKFLIEDSKYQISNIWLIKYFNNEYNNEEISKCEIMLFNIISNINCDGIYQIISTLLYKNDNQ